MSAPIPALSCCWSGACPAQGQLPGARTAFGEDDPASVGTLPLPRGRVERSFVSEPRPVNEVVLCIAQPCRGEYFATVLGPDGLQPAALGSAGRDDPGELSCHRLDGDLVLRLMCGAGSCMVIGCPDDVAAGCPIKQERFQKLGVVVGKSPLPGVLGFQRTPPAGLLFLAA